MNFFKHIKHGPFILLLAVLVGSFLVAGLSYRLLITAHHVAALGAQSSPPSALRTKGGASAYPPPVAPASVLGIVADPQHPFGGIPWVRLSYSTCGNARVSGAALKAEVKQFHSQDVRVMLSLCQWVGDARLFDPMILNDVAQAGADAVQCGNEEMKFGPYTRGVPPGIFARFFDLCQQAVHSVRPGIPVILGANDPHVGGVDLQPLAQQANYLDAMQHAMNTSVHPGGHWNWRKQIIGMIDSWHNGYPSLAVNSLDGLFLYWAQQFGVDLNSGALGKHLWVIEGTGCIYGCGINSSSAYVVAVSHILTLISDLQTTRRYQVPFFYFSARDFYSQGKFWPMGVRDGNDHPKPLRQDLGMGARTLIMVCASRSVRVSSQEQLLARLYNGCSLPYDYLGTLTG